MDQVWAERNSAITNLLRVTPADRRSGWHLIGHLFLFLLLSMMLLFTPDNASAFNCAGKNAEVLAAVCADRELMRLDRRATERLARFAGHSDPVSAMLLRRDQGWVAEILGAEHVEFTGPDDPARKRMIDLLQQRIAMLDHLSGRANGLLGTWANAFGTAKIAALAEGLRLELHTSVTYRDADNDADDEVTCALAGEIRPGGNGWFSGPAAIIENDEQPAIAQDAPIRLRARLQANTLRIVITQDEDHSACDKPEHLTASYFPVGAQSSAAVSNASMPMTAPSFDCATAQRADEQEICSDPDLATKDVEIAAAYHEVLRRLDPKTAGYLREDQRAWVAENVTAYDSQLHPAWDKRLYFIHHTGNARAELELRLNERLAMLTNIDEKRQGMGGLWVGHVAMLMITPDKDKPEFIHATGKKWETGAWKYYCQFDADGRMAGGSFKTDDEFPKLARDGATLAIGDEPKQPGYCIRMRSPKARLFPVKEGTAVGFEDWRFR
jgi:uncharacterized protein